MRSFDMKKKITIVSFHFHPSGSTGARRWSKFARKLADRGHDIRVLTVKYPSWDPIQWINTRVHPNLSIIRIGAWYPLCALKIDRDYIGKIADRILKNTTHLIDAAQWWNLSLEPALTKMHREDPIENLIVTGSPFSCLYHCARFKQKHPAVQLILDYRDPWARNYSMKGFWRKVRFRKGRRMEEFALNMADKVLFVSDGFKEEYSLMFPGYASKFHAIYNGFDKADYVDSFASDQKHDHIRMIYTGRLYDDFLEGLFNLVYAIMGMSTSFSKQFQIHIYSPSDFNLPKNIDSELFEAFNNIVTIKKPVSHREMVGIIPRYDLALSINPKNMRYAIPIKFLDYLGCKARVFHISNGGEVHDMLEQNGHHSCTYDIGDIRRELESFIELKGSPVQDIFQTGVVQKLDLESIVPELEGKLIG
jgi:glycosyltransferase involved in cell wall biosynthesis